MECQVEWTLDENGIPSPDHDPIVGFAVWSDGVRLGVCARHRDMLYSLRVLGQVRFEEWPSKQMLEDAEKELAREQPDQCYECGEYAVGETFRTVVVDTDPGDAEVGPQPDIQPVSVCPRCEKVWAETRLRRS